MAAPKIQTLAVILWRGGRLLAAATALGYGASWFLRRMWQFWPEVPAVVAYGLSLILAGAVLIIGALLCERIRDARRENWKDET